jgi:hypothetical protein
MDRFIMVKKFQVKKIKPYDNSCQQYEKKSALKSE